MSDNLLQKGVDTAAGGIGGAIKGFFKGGIIGAATGLLLGAAICAGIVAFAYFGAPAILSGIIGLFSGTGAVSTGLGAAASWFADLSLGWKLVTAAGAIGGLGGAVALGAAGAAGGTVGGGLGGAAKGAFRREAVSPEMQTELENTRAMNAEKMRLAHQLEQRARAAGGFNNPDARGGNVDRAMAAQEMAGGVKRG